jgi:hypothetical protein
VSKQARTNVDSPSVGWRLENCINVGIPSFLDKHICNEGELNIWAKSLSVSIADAGEETSPVGLVAVDGVSSPRPCEAAADGITAGDSVATVWTGVASGALEPTLDVEPVSGIFDAIAAGGGWLAGSLEPGLPTAIAASGAEALKTDPVGMSGAVLTEEDSTPKGPDPAPAGPVPSSTGET